MESLEVNNLNKKGPRIPSKREIMFVLKVGPILKKSEYMSYKIMIDYYV